MLLLVQRSCNSWCCRLKGQPRSWFPVGKAELTLVKQQPIAITLGQKSSTAYIKISTGQSGGGLSNTGYWGIPVQEDQEYQLSVIIQSESAESAANEVLNFVSKLCSLSMTELWHQVSQTSNCQSTILVICHSSSACIINLSPGGRLFSRATTGL